MTDGENSMADGARKMIKRLDFGVRRMKRPAPVQQSVPAPVERPTTAPANHPTTPAAKRPVISETPSIKHPQAQPAPAPKPSMSNHGLRMDFAPAHSRAPKASPQATISVSKASIRVDDTPVAKATITKATITSAPSPRASTSPVSSSPQVSISSAAPRPVRSRGSMMDFIRRPSQRPVTPKPAMPRSATAPEASSGPASKPAAKPQILKPAAAKKSVKRILRPAPVTKDDVEPLMSDTDLKAALSGFADAAIEEVPRRHHPVARSSQPAMKPATRPIPTRSDQPIMRPAPKPTPRPAGATHMDFATPIKPTRQPQSSQAASIRPTRQPRQQIEPDLYDDFTDDPFGGDGFGDDIDRIEAEIEAEANDFVKEPRPLFEDPLVQLSKAREERDRQLSAEEAQRLKDEARARAGEAAKRAPYAALYSTKSPFLTSVNVEKRPLSARAENDTLHAIAERSEDTETIPSKKSPAKTPHLSRAAKNMKRQLAEDAKEIHRQTVVMSTPEVKTHNTALIIGIILTILLGAGVGALIYLVFFQ